VVRRRTVVIMQEQSGLDPADLVVAWEAVEELLAAVPEGSAKDVLRMVAAGLPADEIAERLDVAVADVEALIARGRIRVLTAAVEANGDAAGPSQI
jgi:DNA-directed RNA polymerase specialized sigma24 family protein